MRSYKTTGIILSRTNLGEADRILTILTRDRGMIRVVGKGLRRAKSKLAGHLEPFNESELMLVKGKSMDVLTSARLVKLPATLVGDYEQLRQAYLFSEIVAKLGGENQHHDGLYELLATSLAELDRGQAGPTLELWFKLGLLDKLGYRPALEGCMICKASDDQRGYRFNLELGGIVDDGCSTAGNLPMDQTQIKLWRIMLSRPPETIREIADIAKLSSEGLVICNAFYDYTFGKRFRSEQVLA
ncbi:MAG TPA: DNA repair protein RecO [Candidatus Saccharimonadales bacterium]|nr:DNA repair protein RecO [Candidatus Saccharimonadales bacterium]